MPNVRNKSITKVRSLGNNSSDQLTGTTRERLRTAQLGLGANANYDTAATDVYA